MKNLENKLNIKIASYICYNTNKIRILNKINYIISVLYNLITENILL